MAVTITGPATARVLTTLATVKRHLGPPAQDPAADALLWDLIRGASAAAESYCSRIFAREAITETVSADGTASLMVSRTPVVVVSQVLNDNSPVTDFLMEDAEAGLLYRRSGWPDSRGHGFFLGEFRPPGLEQLLYAISYVGGYLLPADDVESGALAAAAGDQSYTGVVFPLLVPGDRLLASGFNEASNNGWKTVVSRTASKVIVSGEPLVDEVATATEGPKTLKVSTLPADIELAVLEAIKGWYRSKDRDPEVTNRRVGDLSISYRDPGGAVVGQLDALPVRALGLLRQYQRAA